MKTKFFVLLLIIAVAPIGSVSAQEVTTTSTTTPEEPAVETIDRTMGIVSSTYNEGDGTVTLVIESDREQTVHLFDMGSAQDGGVFDSKKVQLQQGRNRVTVPVTEVSSQIGVTISTDRVLYAHVKKTGSNPFPNGPYSQEDVQYSIAGGGFGVAFMVLYRAARAKLGAGHHGEQVA